MYGNIFGLSLILLMVATSPWSKSACSQYHQHFTRAFFVQKCIQSQTLSRKKLLKRLSYEKYMSKMLMILTPDLEKKRRLDFF